MSASSLAGAGIYGLIAYSVTQRTRELGIRMALGASRQLILRSILVQGVTLAGGGVICGTVAALFATRVLRNFVWGVSTLDPLTFVTVGVLLVAVAAIASLVPAVRAVRLESAESPEDRIAPLPTLPTLPRLPKLETLPRVATRSGNEILAMLALLAMLAMPVMPAGQTFGPCCWSKYRRMRIRRGLGSRRLPCGCVAGIYETYRDEIVTIVDAPGAGCRHPGHLAGSVLVTSLTESTPLASPSPHE